MAGYVTKLVGHVYDGANLSGEALINGVFGGLGFLLAVVLMAGVQEKLEFSNVPESFKGLPISP